MVRTILFIDDNPTGPSLAGRMMDQKEGVEIIWCRSYEEAFAPLFFKKWDLILINSDQKTVDPVMILQRVKNLSDDSTPALLYGDPQREEGPRETGLTRPQELEQILAEFKGKIATLQ